MDINSSKRDNDCKFLPQNLITKITDDLAQITANVKINVALKFRPSTVMHMHISKSSELYPGVEGGRVLLIRGSQRVRVPPEVVEHPGGHQLRVEQHAAVSRQSCQEQTVVVTVTYNKAQSTT